MNAPIDYDRRKPAPSNQIFEAHDSFDPAKGYFLLAFEDDPGGASICFIKDESLIVHSSMWISAEDCAKLGNALLKVAKKGGVA
jgi:hypothetical protein